MYEMTPAQTVHAMQQYEACSWVAVLRSDQTSKALKDGRRLGRLGQRFVKGAKIMMKKRWWEAGERTDIKSNGTYEIWYSRREELEVITLELPSLMWMPYKHCAQSPSLQAYLQALPGFQYRSKGTVVATDGSLRTTSTHREKCRWALVWRVTIARLEYLFEWSDSFPAPERS
jgi:hypothetical protein